MINYTKFLSVKAKQQNVSLAATLRDEREKGSKDIIPMGGGMPDNDIFPFRDATFSLLGGGTLKLSTELMMYSQQYGPTQGVTSLVSQLTSLMEAEHSPPNMAERDVVVSPGSQYSITILTDLLINVGDCVYVEEPAYLGVLSPLQVSGAHVVGIEIDSDGMVPSSLRAALHSRSHHYSKFLYLVPGGGNPTGICMSEQRKRQIYDIASEYDILIIEDDVYYYMQYIETFSPSFLSLDRDGRVIRMDSFSKVLAPGLRISWVTIPKPLAQKIISIMTYSILNASMLSQVIVSELLRTWGPEGFAQHRQKVNKHFRARRDAMMAAATKHLAGLCEWQKPEGGMFVWVKVLGLSDTTALMMACIDRGLLMFKGDVFMLDSNRPSSYIRLSYTPVAVKDMEKGMQILAECIREQLKKSGSEQ